VRAAATKNSRIALRMALRTALAASPWALLSAVVLGVGACNALTGLGQDFQEVDCFHGKGNCADGSVRPGPDGAVALGDGMTGGADGSDLSDGSQPPNPTDDSGGPPPIPPDGSELPDAEAVEGSVGPTCMGGGSCNAGDCHMGTLVCGDAGPVCVGSGTSGDGTHCSTQNYVCLAGKCVACTDSVSCTPTNTCHTGLTSCSTGHSVCVDSGGFVDNLTACGTAGAGTVCEDGSCVVEPKRYAFLTKGTFATTAGIGAADAMCAADAKAAGLAGTYLAGLCTTANSVQGRLPSNGPRWFLPNGTLLGDWSTIFTGSAPSIPLGADGTAHPADSGSTSIMVWTGCDNGATQVTGDSMYSCTDWSSSTTRGVFGDALGGGAVAHLFGWGSTGCGPAFPVYCFQK
jgi:hypothetical protein